MKVFEIKPFGNYDVTFRLAICKTRKEMLSAIAADAKKDEGSNNSTDRTMGMFRSTPCVCSSSVPGIGYSNIFGTMYLNLADVTDEILVHECGHAAFVWEFNILHYTGTFDDGGFDEQENFCYFLGKAAEKVAKIVKDCKRNGKGIRP